LERYFMLGFDNPIHIAFVLVLLLLVFGAKRLPEMGRSLGSGLRGFKESISGEHDPAQHLAAAPTVAPMTVAQPTAASVNVVAQPTPMPVSAQAPMQFDSHSPATSVQPTTESVL
jgi:sec-independent protein translocase protein TatA